KARSLGLARKMWLARPSPLALSRARWGAHLPTPTSFGGTGSMKTLAKLMVVSLGFAMGSLAAGCGGSDQRSDEDVTGSGGGTGSGGMADSFHFVYRPMVGDAELLGRMTTLAMQDSTLIPDPTATAGLMIRDSLDPDAAMVYVGPVGDGKTGGQIVVRTKKGD